MGAYTRKATFVVITKNNKRVGFTPVNKRARIVVRNAGKRTKIAVEELKALKGKGSYTFHAYASDGSLKPIKF